MTPIFAARRVRVFKPLALAVAALSLYQLIITSTLSGALATTNASLALWLNPSQSEANLSAAEAVIATEEASSNKDKSTTAPSAALPGRIDDDVQLKLSRAIASAPASANANAAFAAWAGRAGREVVAKAANERAAVLSVRQAQSLVGMLQEKLQAGDNAAAVAAIDALLRTSSRAMEAIAPVLTALAEQPSTVGLVKDLLATNPPWRSQYFANMTRSIRDARTPLLLFTSLRGQASPATDRDVATYLQFLVGKGFFELAYYTWLDFLPPERLSRVGLVYNGSFEFELSGAPFDWQLSAGRGTVLDIEAHPERTDARRLVVDVGQGRVEFGVRQMLVLGPGNYQFTAEMSGAIVGRRGLRWRMRCIAGSQIGETEQLFGKSGEVLPVAMTFKVAEGCKAQLLSLELDARSASEQLVTGRVWFSALTVRPKDTLRP